MARAKLRPARSVRSHVYPLEISSVTSAFDTPVAIQSIPPLSALAPCDTLVIAVPESGELSPTARVLDESQGGWVSRAIAAGTIRCKRGETTLMPGFSEDGAAMVMFIGVGDLTELTRSQAFDLGATAIRQLTDKSRSRVIVAIGEVIGSEFHDAVVAGAVTGPSNQSLYSTEPRVFPPEALDWTAVDPSAIEQGRIVGESINLTRHLVNEPPNRIFPESFAEVAKQIAGETGLAVEVWDEQRLADEGCRAMLAVGAASSKPPRLVILRHRGGGEQEPIYAVVGKGVTFDSGGLSIKPSEGMVDMKCDMAGAATVLGVMRAVALLKLPIHVVGLCGLVENMIAGNAYRLGDVIETRSGKTIEILNTDAEGRVVLADVLDVAIQHEPVAMIDLATLTGACMVALGRDVTGMMTNHAGLIGEVTQAARHEGELVWELPMFEHFGEQVKSKVADIKNIGDGRWGGAITAAKFLENFVESVPWVHLDIAGPAFNDAAKPARDGGATGVMVRTLIHWLRSKT